MDLADFPRLQKLYLSGTDDFPALESLSLPNAVYGGNDFKFQNVFDVPGIMQAIHLLLQRTPALFHEYWLPRALAEDSRKTLVIGTIGNEEAVYSSGISSWMECISSGDQQYRAKQCQWSFH